MMMMMMVMMMMMMMMIYIYYDEVCVCLPVTKNHHFPLPSFGLVMMMMMNYFSVERDGGAFWHSLLIRGAREGGRSNSYRQISGCDIILVLFLMHTLD